MKLGIQQSARLEQRLVQSPQMIQAMQILQLPTVDLVERVEQELAENPFLEVKESTTESERPAPKKNGNGSASALEALEQFERAAGELHAPRRPLRLNRDASDQKYEALQNAPERGESLAEYLIALLHLQDLSPKERAIGEYIIYSLNERGYLIESPESVTAAIGPEVTVEEVTKMIRLIQELGSPGIAARDLKECLLLQIDRLGGDHHLSRILVERSLEDIQANRLPKIAKETGRPISEIKEAIEFLRKLDPRPGGHNDGGPSAVIHPDVVVEEVDGKYELRLERGGLPEIQISPAYREMLSKAKGDPRVHEFLKRRIEAAKSFLDAVLQRQSTIEKICREIVRRQRDFFERGVEALHPLKMQEVADAVGVHISTVSRAIAGKYIQTPQGIFELKFFFTGGTRTESGEVESQTAIKEMVVEIVASEDHRNPLSDEEIAKILKDTKGLLIARRTVTKYRKSLKLPSSNLRRQY